MPNPVFCECGAVLVEDVSAEGVTPLGGTPIRFRRDTDYVVCTNCHKVYRAKTLQDGGTAAESLVTDSEVASTEAPEAADVIASLEKMLEADE